MDNYFEELTFGSWGNEPITWLVLKKEGNKALIISKLGLDAGPYNETRADLTWEECTLRKWLNNTFFYAGFTMEEKQRVLDTVVKNPDNVEYEVVGGNDTTDKVFLLSIDEARELFPSNDARMTYSTDFAKGHHAYVADNGNAWWCLRSPGYHRDYCAYVSSRGVPSAYGMLVNYPGYTFRPAMWIEL